jgi:hypothetical protein
VGYVGYRFTDAEIDKITGSGKCNAHHPWWSGIRCELEPGHRSDMHESELDGYRVPAKIKWQKEEDDDRGKG